MKIIAAIGGIAAYQSKRGNIGLSKSNIISSISACGIMQRIISSSAWRSGGITAHLAAAAWHQRRNRQRISWLGSWPCGSSIGSIVAA